MAEEQRKKKSALQELKDAIVQGYEMTSEDRRDYLQFIRDLEGKAEAPRASMTFIQHPGIEVLRQAQASGDMPNIVRPISDESLLHRGNYGLMAGPQMAFDIPVIEPGDAPEVIAKKKADTARLASGYRKQLKDLPNATKAGYALGSMASDITNDASRNLWWLFNASQAIGNIGSEFVANVVNPALFEKENLSINDAVKQGLIRYVEPDDSDFNPDFESSADWDARQRQNISNYRRDKPGVKFSKIRNDPAPIGRRRFNQNAIQAATTLPIGLAINAGIGLMGRREGYAATVPDEDDPRQTSNAVAEVASRYFLGREGNLLPVEDFLLERPDVSAAEYASYKNYLRDRDIDLNPFDDGRVNLGGVLKTNPDGIRGAEVSFLGKSLPVNDTIVPALSALVGTAVGAYIPKRFGMKNKAATIGTLFGGGMAGLAAGTTAGSALENERRRRNFEENNPGIELDQYKKNAADLLELKTKMQRENPNADTERAESKVGFSKRAQQQALQTKALEQQVLIDQLLNTEKKAEANNLMATQQWALKKASAIDQEIAKRRGSQEEEQPMTLSL